MDFSGARLAGRTTWVAKAQWVGRGAGRRLRLLELESLERLCGTAERAPALAHLVRRIARSRCALWAIGAPFGLPVEVLDDGMTWPALLRFVRGWAEHEGYDLGLWALERARALGGPLHVYRATDRAARTPFDAYHYRIIYQTFHGMRDVLWPLARVRETAIMPFHYRRLPRARRVVVETCQSSTLKRLGLPHQNYKQPEGGPLSARRRRTRRAILAGLAPLVDIDAPHRRRIARDSGGDALDAVIAAVGAATGWESADHRAVAGEPRYRREGFQYW
ncbi:MAG: DUF429 domain-containing protein [Gemmatimonadaceae bacterium]